MAGARRNARKCAICGTNLIGDFYYAGRCRQHQTTKDFDVKISQDVVAAESQGLSYGQYMALKEKEVQSHGTTGKRRREKAEESD